MKKIIYLHIPKAGGTTINSIIDRNYKKGKIYGLDGFNLEERVNNFVSLPNKENYDIIRGHMGFGIHKYINAECIYFTMLRNPIDRIISHYYYAKSNPKHYLYNTLAKNEMSLHDYVSSGLTPELHNDQVRLLSSEDGFRVSFKMKKKMDVSDLGKAIDNINNKFAFVGLLDYFDLSIIFFAKIFTWEKICYIKKNVTIRKENIISDETIQIIINNNVLDIQLYQYCLNRIREYYDSNPQYLESKLKHFRQLNKYYTYFRNFLKFK